jgi:hypothetical protein
MKPGNEGDTAAPVTGSSGMSAEEHSTATVESLLPVAAG